MELLEVNHLCKTYGSGETAVHALKDVSFSVPKGEYVAVVGESGSGKSTLLNLIGGLDTPTSGKVLIDGKDVFAMKDRELTIFRRRNIGFIFQAFNLIPEIRADHPDDHPQPQYCADGRPGVAGIGRLPDRFWEVPGMSSTEMKSYLSLIPISAKVRRRQNRMTILCIVLAVFLVTVVFSMADMAIRMETSNQLNKNGNWHIMVKDISPETAAELAAQEDVAAFSAYSDINASLTENYFAGDKRAALVGADDAILQIFPGMQCSTAPADGEVLVTANIRDWLDVTVGTAIPLTLPDGRTISLTVAGFNEDTSDANQYDAVVLVMNRSTFSQIAAQVEESFETQYFIQFKPRTNLRQSIVNIENKYGISEEKISENTYLMALNASSNNDYIVGLYAVAAVLAGMVVLAGIFMITGSINSNVAQRTSYYGMLRCLGAGKNQVRMLVRLEALFWCKTAVPAGCVLGIVSTWGLCSFLRGFIGEEFSSLPVLGISPVGIICGSALGLITVWFAASSPARRAAKASPITAATGNAVENAADSPCHARLFGSRAELSLGVSHATSSKKNLLLMTGSFALSILLFLSFSVLLRWVGFALNPVQSYAPDLSVAETSGQNVLDPVLVEQLEALPEVKHAFGRMYCPLPAEYQGKQGSIDLISYDTIQFGWAKKDLIGGTLPQEPEDGTYPVLTVFDKSNSLTVGDTIQLEDAKLTVVGVLNDSPFSSTDSPIVICTEETFHQLTGQNRYAVIDIQLKDTTADTAIAQIHTLLSDTLNKQVVFSNRIEGNRMIQSTYWAFHLVVYAFLIVIAGITILNIINSISMSVSARMKQYGILRAIGMDDAQLKRMISAEAGTYAVSGLVVGIALGLVLNRKLYILLITHYFGAAWQVPWGCLAVIVVVVLAAVVLAVYNPVRRILMQPITATISEL